VVAKNVAHRRLGLVAPPLALHLSERLGLILGILDVGKELGDVVVCNRAGQANWRNSVLVPYERISSRAAQQTYD
jgi:hypothetical protein